MDEIFDSVLLDIVVSFIGFAPGRFYLRHASRELFRQYRIVWVSVKNFRRHSRFREVNHKLLRFQNDGSLHDRIEAAWIAFNDLAKNYYHFRYIVSEATDVELSALDYKDLVLSWRMSVVGCDIEMYHRLLRHLKKKCESPTLQLLLEDSWRWFQNTLETDSTEFLEMILSTLPYCQISIRTLLDESLRFSGYGCMKLLESRSDDRSPLYSLVGAFGFVADFEYNSVLHDVDGRELIKVYRYALCNKRYDFCIWLQSALLQHRNLTTEILSSRFCDVFIPWVRKSTEQAPPEAFFRWLVQRMEDFNNNSSWCYTPLDCLVGAGCEELTRIALSKGAKSFHFEKLATRSTTVGCLSLLVETLDLKLSEYELIEIEEASRHWFSRQCTPAVFEFLIVSGIGTRSRGTCEYSNSFELWYRFCEEHDCFSSIGGTALERLIRNDPTNPMAGEVISRLFSKPARRRVWDGSRTFYNGEHWGDDWVMSTVDEEETNAMKRIARDAASLRARLTAT
jgi:hypothetical protein